MRYYGPYVFNRFDNLVKKLKDKMDPFGALVKLGKETAVEKRCIDVYTKGMIVLKQRYFFYKEVVAGKIEYSPEVGTKSNYKDRALKALQACHWRAAGIKEKLNRLISIEVPERYKIDFGLLLYYQDRNKETKSNFMKTCNDIAVSQGHVLESGRSMIVSDCEMLGFCVCHFYNVPPYMHGCIRSNVDLLDDDEFMKKFKEGAKICAKWLDKTYGLQARK